MTALKTHLLRAVYDWAMEGGFTPHIVVDTKALGARVPPGYADKSGRIVLNIHPRALQGFTFDDTWIRFSARFGGVAQVVEVPFSAVLAIYAKENGQGISFPDPASESSEGEPQEPDPTDGAPRKRPSLRVVK
jgi:stringent starvation protein B